MGLNLHDSVSEQRQSVQPMWRSVLMVALATYVPFIWLVAYPDLLLQAMGGPLVPGFLAAQFLVRGLVGGRFAQFTATVLVLAFFTWLSRRGARMQSVAISIAFVLSLLQSLAIALIFQLRT